MGLCFGPMKMGSEKDFCSLGIEGDGGKLEAGADGGHRFFALRQV